VANYVDDKASPQTDPTLGPFLPSYDANGNPIDPESPGGLPLGLIQGSPIEDIPMANPFTSFLGKLNPTQLLLGGLSLFGGSNDPFQHRESFSNTGADPVRTLSGALDAIRGLSANLGHRGPTQMRGVVPTGPEPVSVPGLPFQIGGGLGTDPALMDPSILQVNHLEDPFGSQDQAQPRPAVNRRNPNGQ
jgi:hypothetical protein